MPSAWGRPGTADNPDLVALWGARGLSSRETVEGWDRALSGGAWGAAALGALLALAQGTADTGVGQKDVLEGGRGHGLGLSLYTINVHSRGLKMGTSVPIIPERHRESRLQSREGRRKWCNRFVRLWKSVSAFLPV